MITALKINSTLDLLIVADGIGVVVSHHDFKEENGQKLWFGYNGTRHNMPCVCDECWGRGQNDMLLQIGQAALEHQITHVHAMGLNRHIMPEGFPIEQVEITQWFSMQDLFGDEKSAQTALNAQGITSSSEFPQSVCEHLTVHYWSHKADISVGADVRTYEITPPPSQHRRDTDIEILHCCRTCDKWVKETKNWDRNQSYEISGTRALEIIQREKSHLMHKKGDLEKKMAALKAESDQVEQKLVTLEA